MKNAYLDPEFSDFWEARCGDEGQAYQRYVLDPLLFQLLGSLAGKDVLEVGCGNGYLAKKLLAAGAQNLILLDVSPYNLGHARKRCTDSRVNFVCQDAAQPWPIAAESLDVIVSHMALNEMDDIASPAGEAFRVLKRGGVFAFSVFHPAFDLYVYAQQQAGKAQHKIKGIDGYFVRKYTAYNMGAESKTCPDLYKRCDRELFVQHYHRPAADYHETLTAAGFTVRRLLEPELNSDVLENHPAFTDYADRPVALLFLAEKPSPCAA